MINTLNKLEIERNFFNLVNDINEKSTTNFILNGENLKAFLLRSEIRMLTFSRVIRQQKK